MAGNKYEGKGETIFDAIGALPVDYTKIKTKGTVTVTKGFKKAERFLYLRPLRLVFANKTRRAGLAKQLQSLLK